MTKVKLAEATKEINQQAGTILEDAARIKKNLDAVMQSLRKQEAKFQRDEEEQRARKRQEEQQLLAQQHTKAWTMPDEDEAAQAAPAVPKEEKAEEKNAAPKAEKKPEAPKAEEKPAAAAPVAEKKPEQPVPKAEAPKEEEKPEAPKAAEKPAAPKAEAPKAEEKPAAPKTEAPKADAKPAAAAPVQPRPVAAPTQGVRPAAPGQRPQQPYGRPANPAGPYGRPANPAGPYGRPANPNQQYGRPANPAGPYGRPANANGQPYGRPAGGPGAGQGGRPPMGGAPRPQGARPAGGAPRSRGPELTPVVEKERVSNYDPNKKQFIRQHDPEHVAKNRKQLVKESFNGFDDETVRGGKKARSKKQPSAQQMMAPIKIEKAYMTAETITVKDLTERIGKPAGEILKKLLMLGIMANINSELDFDTASLVCSEFGVELEKKLDKTAEDALSDTNFEDSEEDLQPRPPVITIMGHVDHGKTSLLDYIRKAHVTSTEAGGITQHIGAYTVKLNGRQITFLDTPGHEAFTAMRMRGAQATDIAVLVVAADDGVMPQTVEAINHAKAAGVPIVVAISKMDKPGANPERIMQDLTKYDLVPEAWGGDTIMVPVSALTGEGVDDLLEMILLQADVLQLRANPNRMAKGVIIEAKLDKARGPLATVLLRTVLSILATISWRAWLPAVCAPC